MAQGTTYDSLINDVQIYAERSDSAFISQIPRLLSLAESRISEEVKNLGLIQYVSGNVSINNPVMAKPVRWRRTISFKILVNGAWQFLYPRSNDYCRMFWPDQTKYDVPSFYADYDYEHFLLVATPNLAYQFELAYHERPQPLDSTNQTNWTTRYAPELLLYATLLEAQPFLKNLDKLQMWQQLYQQKVQALDGEEQLRLVDRTVQRTQD